MKIAKHDVKKMRERRDIEGLIKACGDEDCFVQQEARLDLENIGKPAVKPLIRALQDEDSDVRWRVIEALGEIGDMKGVKPLIRALQDEDSDVRWRVIEALGEIEDMRRIEPLNHALQDEDLILRRSAAKALENIRKPAAYPIIQTKIQTKKMKAQAA